MYANYLKVALRNLLRNKVYSLINIGGLAQGLACCLLIVTFIQYEMSFDSFHTNSDRLYRLTSRSLQEAGQWQVNFAAGFATQIETDVSDVETVIRTCRDNSPILRYGSTKLYANGMLYVDSTFFTVFSFPLVKGDPKTALSSPSSLIITESAAKALFGDEDPMGKTIGSDNKQFVVTAVAKDVPGNSHLWFQYIAPFRGGYLPDSALSNMTNWNYPTYILLKPGATAAHANQQLAAFLERRLKPGEKVDSELRLQPLREIHFGRNMHNDPAIVTDPRYLYTLGLIGAVMLFIACANFMNLSTARSMRRAREVGLRKVLGTIRSHLVMQFLGESLLVALISVPLAIAFAELLLPVFDEYVGRRLNLLSVVPLLSLFVLAILTGLVGGLYPAFYLSWFKPIDVLKGRFQSGREGLVARRVLIILQYTIATVLMIATLVVLRQFQYMSTADPGYQRDHLIQLTMTTDIRNAYDTFRAQLLQNPHIVKVSRVASSPGYAWTQQTYFVGEGTARTDTAFLPSMAVDADFVSTMGIQVLEGRDFSRDHPTDETESYLVNESAVKKLGLKDPIGYPFRVWSGKPGKIIGVVKNFNFHSLREPIDPLALRQEPGWCGLVLVRIAPTDVNGTIAYIEKLWNERSPDHPFSYRFHDDALARLYDKESRLTNMLTYLTGAALFIASLGLFGLASYSAEQRLKELGVRKVLGASTGQLVGLLTRQFTVWVLIAVGLASPVAYFIIGRWLQNFAFRVSVSWEVFAVTVLTAVTIAVLTVILQAIRAARMNPAEALKYE